jgi:peptidylprolyl isomerase
MKKVFNIILIIACCVNLTGCKTMDNIKKEEEKNVSKIAVFETNQGDIEFELFTEVAPKTCENFQGLIENGYYDGIAFHRVIKDFMIQGGDPTGTGAGGASLWGEPFDDECVEEVSFDTKGILAMANAGPGTNGSQFFITTVPTPHLNMRHTIFGKVVSGYDVVEKIENVETGMADKPVEEQVIVKAYVK